MFGLKAALSGHDIKTSPDSKMAFHSGWQTLRILKEDTFVIPAGDTNVQVFYNHGLTYAPLYWVFFDQTRSHYPKGTSHFWSNTLDPRVVVDEVSIKKAQGASVSSETRGRFVIFENPLEQNYKASIDILGTNESIAVNRFGVRAGNIASDDKRDLTLDSTTRTPLIHTVKSEDFTTNQVIEIHHDLGELPEYFAYAKLQGNDYWQIVSNAEDSSVTSTKTTTTMTLATTPGKYSLWVLKQSIVRD